MGAERARKENPAERQKRVMLGPRVKPRRPIALRRPPRAQVEACTAQLEASGARWALQRYGGAAHGFTNPAQDLNPRQGFGYNAEAAEAAWAATIHLLSEAL